MKPTNEEIKYYKETFKQMFDFIKKYFKRNDLKYPSIVLNYVKQNDDMFIKTGYFDPNTKQIVLFMDGRHKKDIGRSFFHECCHYIQDVDGVIAKSGYTGNKITEDKNLVKLEEEAYLKGNMAFRSWTEEEQKKGKLK